MTWKELIDETARLEDRFVRFESRPWSVEAMGMELLAEAGSVADCLMVREGYRKARAGQTPDLADELADVMFVVLMIARRAGIDLEGAYRRMLEETHRKLNERAAQAK